MSAPCPSHQQGAGVDSVAVTFWTVVMREEGPVQVVLVVAALLGHASTDRLSPLPAGWTWVRRRGRQTWRTPIHKPC